MNDSDFAIITRYQQEYRGLVQYYIFAIDIHVFNKLHWIMEQSLLQTLAAKHKTTVSTMRTKYRTQVKTPAGKSLQCLEVRVERKDKTPLLARFGGIELTRRTQAILEETPPIHKNQRTELLKRLMADECELCGSRENIEVHHIRKLADLNRKDGRATPQWVKRMAAMRRKTLIVCHSCHQKIHRGQLSLSTQPQVI